MGAERVNKLKWLCRRGMKELDILLESFVKQNQQLLESGGWPEFETLLGIEDDVFWTWVQHPEHEDAMTYRDLLERIRHGRG